MTKTTQVPVVAGVASYLSKSNLTQIVGVAATIITFTTGGKVGMSPAEQAAVVTTICFIQGLVTYVMHTWFTPHVHASSI